MAGTLLRRFCDSRGARISWLIVGIRRFFALRPWDRSLPTAAAHATTRRSSRKRNRTKPLLQRFGARAARGPHPLGRGRGAQLGVSSVAAFWRPVHRSLGRPWNIGWPTACPESEVGITHPAVIVKHCLEKTHLMPLTDGSAKPGHPARKIQLLNSPVLCTPDPALSHEDSGLNQILSASTAARSDSVTRGLSNRRNDSTLVPWRLESRKQK